MRSDDCYYLLSVELAGFYFCSRLHSLPRREDGGCSGGLLAVIVLMAAVSVWMNHILQPFRLTEAVAIVGLSNAAFLILCASFNDRVIWR
jgi:hypothetical protein